MGWISEAWHLRAALPSRNIMPERWKTMKNIGKTSMLRAKACQPSRWHPRATWLSYCWAGDQRTGKICVFWDGSNICIVNRKVKGHQIPIRYNNLIIIYHHHLTWPPTQNNYLCKHHAWTTYLCLFIYAHRTMHTTLSLSLYLYIYIYIQWYWYRVYIYI